MTLALALRAADGLVMASDSRMSGGSGSADISEKFLQVNRDVGVMTYGLAVPGNRGIRTLVDEVKNTPGSYSTMAEIVNAAVRIFSNTFWDFMAENRTPDGAIRPELENQVVGFVVGGFDGNETGQFLVYQMESPEFHLLPQPQVIAAQWPLASMLLPLLAYPGMSVQSALDAAVIAMLLTADVEPTVGGPVHLASVTLSEGFSLLHQREVASVIDRNQRRLSELRNAWLEAWRTGTDSEG